MSGGPCLTEIFDVQHTILHKVIPLPILHGESDFANVWYLEFSFHQMGRDNDMLTIFQLSRSGPRSRELCAGRVGCFFSLFQLPLELEPR